MKKSLFLIAMLCSTVHMVGQKGWFTLYQDSTMLVKDAEKITTAFKNDIKKLSPNTKYEIKAVLKTTPYLIYYDERDLTANLPIWEQVIPEQKSFFYEVAGGEAEGKEIFGLFFNGFYLFQKYISFVSEVLKMRCNRFVNYFTIYKKLIFIILITPYFI